MLLPDHAIDALCVEPTPLIEPYDPYALQPASYDLTLGRQFCFPGPNEVPFITTEFRLLPWKLILACTRERLWLPRGIAAEVSGRSSNARRGIQIEAAGHVDPGYCGMITLEIVNFSDTVLILEKDMGIAKVVFHRLESDCKVPYNANRNTHQYSHGPRPS